MGLAALVTAAALILSGSAATGGAMAAASSPAPSNNLWSLTQDPGHPWRGTPQALVADHRDGAAASGLAVFSDPRWSARAIAIDLRDLHAGGARSAGDYASGLTRECVRIGLAACPGPDQQADWAAALARPFQSGSREDLQLFDSAHLPRERLRAALAALAIATTGSAPAEALLDVAAGAVGDADLDQSQASFERWLSRELSRRGAVAAFEARLQAAGVAQVAPTWQILRTGSDWRGCGAPFDVPPPELQPNIVPTLRLVRDRVAPALGRLEAKSAYRGPWLNLCAGGAERSAHREFSAVDLTPLAPMSRAQLMGKLCPIYVGAGEADRLGLGFYAGVRFHMDTQRHRSWASENGRAYAPCDAAGGVNPPLPPLPPQGSVLPPAPPSR